MCSNAKAILGESPARPFSSLDNVLRAIPRRREHSVTVQPFASMLSRNNSPGCAWLEFDALIRGYERIESMVGSES